MYNTYTCIECDSQFSDKNYSVLALEVQQSSLVLAVLSHPCIDYLFLLTKYWKKIITTKFYTCNYLVYNSWISFE